MIYFLAGVIVGGAVVALYNHFLSSRVEKVGQDVIAAFEKIKSKV